MFFEQLLQNKPIWIGILSWTVAQFIKILTTLLREKKLDLTRFYGAGGMPSSHSALICSVAACIGRQEGFQSASFAVSLVMSAIVMYDAAGVRQAAGKQAAAINILFSHNGISVDEKLKELLGHTPLQVTAGAILGIFIGCIL